MKKNRILFFGVTLCHAVVWLLLGEVRVLQAEEPLRVGHFRSVTHAQGVIAHLRSKNGARWLEERVGRPVEWYVYDSGPSAMEALLAGSLDVSYVGPNPVLNLFVRAKGQRLHVISGAARGGSGLVVRKGLDLRVPSDFRGRKVATPQFGNTQDVSARFWFGNGGLKVTRAGGDLQIIPTAGPDQVLLLRRGDIDAAWTVEPWLSILETDGGAELILEEKDAVTTVVAASAKFLKDEAPVAKAFLRAHEELTDWIVQHPLEAQQETRDGIAAFSGREIPAELVAGSWKRMSFSNKVTREDFEVFLVRAQSAGFLKDVDPELLKSFVVSIGSEGSEG